MPDKFIRGPRLLPYHRRLLDVPLDDLADIRGLNLRGREGGGLLGDYYREILHTRRPAAVRAFDQRGVERDHVHQHAKAESLLQQPPKDF